MNNQATTNNISAFPAQHEETGKMTPLEQRFLNAQIGELQKWLDKNEATARKEDALRVRNQISIAEYRIDQALKYDCEQDIASLKQQLAGIDDIIAYAEEANGNYNDIAGLYEQREHLSQELDDLEYHYATYHGGAQ